MVPKPLQKLGGDPTPLVSTTSQNEGSIYYIFPFRLRIL